MKNPATTITRYTAFGQYRATIAGPGGESPAVFIGRGALRGCRASLARLARNLPRPVLVTGSWLDAK